jgi:hypothetical protein
MTKATQRPCNRIAWMWLVPILLLISMLPCKTGWAAFGEDLEKPKPEFSREENKITAKLIPRAKSTSVLIRFEVSGGNLVDVEGLDFEKARSPSVDTKDFKSELFTVTIDGINTGGEVKLSITSDFFSGSTEYWIYNPKAKDLWVNSEAQNISHPDLVQQLVITAKDGGPFDSDGAADGRIILKGGPKDSFWGYALGTLFIRFFGIFLVLGILMIGMILSGKIFSAMDKKAAAAEESIEPHRLTADEDVQPMAVAHPVSIELATAVSLALHMHFSGLQSSQPVRFFTPEITPWARQGRERIMNSRYITVNLKNRLQNR